MKEDNKYAKHDIERLYLYPDGASSLSNKFNINEWKTNIYLPEGWLCQDKKKGSNEIILRSSSGIRLKTYKGVANYTKLSDEYSQEIINRMYLYQDGKSHKTGPRLEDWKTSQ